MEEDVFFQPHRAKALLANEARWQGASAPQQRSPQVAVRRQLPLLGILIILLLSALMTNDGKS